MKTLQSFSLAMLLASSTAIFADKTYTVVTHVKYAQGYLDGLIAQAGDISKVDASKLTTTYAKNKDGNNKEDATVLSYLTTDQIKALSPAQVKALSVNQLKALSTEQGLAVTTEQKAVLSADQLAILPTPLTFGTSTITLTTGQKVS